MSACWHKQADIFKFGRRLGLLIMEDRREYQKEYRQRQKEYKRELRKTQPGRYIRCNPDYDQIMVAIEEEQAGEVKNRGKAQ